MRPGAVRVDTLGSIFWMHDESRTYLRMPREEKPRKPEWGGPDAGPLQDLVWHPMESWEVVTRRGQELLVIWLGPGPDGKRNAVVAPDAVVVS